MFKFTMVSPYLGKAFLGVLRVCFRKNVDFFRSNLVIIHLKMSVLPKY